MTKSTPAARKPSAPKSPLRIEYLRVQNFRALKDVELSELTPLTVLLGPNGSGKSTLFDVFNFLSECFTLGLRHAWEERNRFQELRTRGSEGRIVIELRYREKPNAELATYHLEIDEDTRGPFVAEEWLKWRRVAPNVPGAPYKILDFKKGKGWVLSGERPEQNDTKVHERLDEPDMLAVSTLGRLAKNARVAALRRFISDWYVSYLSVSEMREQPKAGAQERLSKTGDNLPNVIQFLAERHPERLEHVFELLRQRVPRLEKVLAETMKDGRLLLQIKDAPFDIPVLSKFASDGTLKVLTYLVLLNSPTLPQFIGIEEPENFLHPRLLIELAEACRGAAGHSQVLVTTHSPFFLDGARPKEVRVLYRDDQGYTQVVRASDIQGIEHFLAAGAQLGHLWLEGHFGLGDPLVNSGMPARKGRPR